MAARKPKKGAGGAAKKAATTRPRSIPQHTPRTQPESLRLRSLSVGFTVNDLPRSLAFYTRILGFVAGEKWEQDGKLMGMEFKAGQATIWLNQDDFAKGRDRVKGIGVRLYCNTAQDVDTIAAGIKKRGGTLDHEPETHPWGGRDFGLTDPDGYKITFHTA
jgi:uncharacterized glyoxalase superfamily protein PhnB